ncbi:hypothetical protein KKE78_04545 [Patescibacteria group bacterium]|nr:hypothetical protein [Patescibacteria group bacterium]
MTAVFEFTVYSLRSAIKLFLILLVFIFTFYILHFTFLNSAYAQTNTSTSNESLPATLKTSNSAFEVSQYPVSTLPPVISPTSPLYTDLLVNNMFHTFSCLAIGQSLINQPCLTYQTTRDTQGVIQNVPVLSQVNLSGGALGAVTSAIEALYINPPVKTTDYLASVGQGLGVVKEAYAVKGEPSGAAVLSPIMKLWQVSRNFSYIIMIIVFLIIGLMIMFRNKINPQTVITAQAALPGLVIGLILITFSYFLAGLISDVAFVGTNVVGYYFQAAQDTTTTTTLVQKTQDQNVLSIFSKFTGMMTSDDIATAIDSIFNSFTTEVQNQLRIFAGIIAFQFSSQLGGALPIYGSIFGPFVGIVSAITIQTAVSPILGFFFSFIAIAILIYTMLRLFLRLVTSYLNIIFLTLTAPFQFLVASLPGRQGIAAGWFLNMLSHVLAFPAIMAVFYFVNYLLGSNAVTDSPFTVNSQAVITESAIFPLLGGMKLSFLRVVVAFGALLATPAIPDIICKAIGQTSQAGQLIGQQISGGISGGRGYANQLTTASEKGMYAVGTGIAGETVWSIDKEGKASKHKTKPGIRELWSKEGLLGRFRGGAGRGIPQRNVSERA